MAFKTIERIKICVCGELASGKSSLVLQFIQTFFTADLDPTVEDGYQKTIEIDNKAYILDILDTADTDYADDSRRETQLLETDIILLVYSITNEDSFHSLMLLHEKITSILNKKYIPVILVGAQNDLETQRQVSFQSGEKLASEFKFEEFVECSAKSAYNVQRLFEDAARIVIKIREAAIEEEVETNQEEIFITPTEEEVESGYGPQENDNTSTNTEVLVITPAKSVGGSNNISTKTNRDLDRSKQQSTTSTVIKNQRSRSNDACCIIM